HHGPLVRLLKRPEQLLTRCVRSRVERHGREKILVRVEREWGSAQVVRLVGIVPAQEAQKSLPHGRIGDEEYTISHRSTPAAKRDPRSMPPFHSFNRGWSVPLMIVAAPFAAMREQRT